MGADAAKKRKGEARAEPATLDARVADAKHVFIGEGVRIYFVDRQLRETPYIRAEGGGAYKSAMIVVKIVKMLKPAAGDHPAQILVPITTSKDVYGEGSSPYDREVERHVGKQGIWHGDIVVRREYGEASNPRPLENPVTLLNPARGDTRKAALAPLPMARLKQVTEMLASSGRKVPQGELAKSTSEAQ